LPIVIEPYYEKLLNCSFLWNREVVKIKILPEISVIKKDEYKKKDEKEQKEYINNLANNSRLQMLNVINEWKNKN
jgi:hypothetical protein